MTATVRKYGVVFSVALSERLVYRADFFIATFLRFIPMITTVLLWRAIYEGAQRDEVGGLRYTQMVSYYLFVMVARAFGSMPRLATDVAADIREGGLRKYLLQPIDYIAYHLSLRSAHKLVYFVMAFVPYALVFWLCRGFLPDAPDATALGLSLISLVLAFLLGFSINMLIGLLAFWFLEVASFVHVFMTAQYFLSGHMFPLSLLPDWLQPWITVLPFAYETYYPTLILLQRLDPARALDVIAVQLIWVVVLMGLTRFAWARGLRRYAAFGG
ncbi:MAG: ABC transporter permease [Planctomycetota bacterium]|nr:MAG: ABC transporter permease [Planctomycetota bacterium]